MKKFFILGLTIVILAVVSSVWNGVSAQTHQSSKTEAIRATDAAYRDGLFLGGFDARSGRVHPACVGRWSTRTDRTAFSSGYADGYAQAVADNGRR